MKIKYLEYKNNAFEWEIKPIHFDNLTLLVGASGVGKTQILNAIYSLKQVTKGVSLNGVSWCVQFDSFERKYKWLGEFEKKSIIEEYVDEDTEEDIKNRPKIKYEMLYMNDELILDRNNERIKFHGQETLKLSPFESIIKILYQEDDIKPVFSGFEKVIFDDQSESRYISTRFSFIQPNKVLEKYNDIDSLINSDENITRKLFWVYKKNSESFNKIKERFIEVFPQVEDIKIEQVQREDLFMFSDANIINIKEKGVNSWIEQFKISSGMYRTLMHLSELTLCANETVILIDEFENSLGINCLNVLTEDLISEREDLQFIITSHHPYIINNIGMEHWKIVTRLGGVIETHNTDEFDIGKSMHDAFIQLINLPSYKSGSLKQ